jgi:hypothetical protein
MDVKYPTPAPVGSPLLSGAREIAECLGLSRRETYYLIQKGRIGPVFRLVACPHSVARV